MKRVRRISMRSKSFVVGMFALLVILFAAASQSPAQAVYGSIIGTITDPQGAAVGGAKVSVASVTKGTTDQVTTNADGNYSVTHLLAGTYNIKAEAQGFKTF